MTVGDVLAQLLTLAVTALAAYRIWRLIGYDDITAGWRDPLVDDHRMWVVKIYDGLTCPWCAGTWIAFAVVAVAAQVVSIWLPVAHAFAAATLVGWLHTKIEDG